MNRDEIIGTIVHQIRYVIPDLDQRVIGPGERLADLGANSLDRAEIVMLTLTALSLDIPRTETFGPTNIGELADLLHRKLHGQ